MDFCYVHALSLVYTTLIQPDQLQVNLRDFTVNCSCFTGSNASTSNDWFAKGVAMEMEYITQEESKKSL